MIVRGEETVIVQGITGRQGTFWAERMAEYGTKIIGGVNPDYSVLTDPDGDAARARTAGAAVHGMAPRRQPTREDAFRADRGAEFQPATRHRS